MADLYTTPSPPQGTSGSASPGAAGEKKGHKEQPRIRRRNRLITSCLECRRRKLKCDKQQPCTNCTKFSRDCLFIAPALDSAGQAKLAEVKEKMGMLERTLEEDVARRTSKKSSSAALMTSPPLPGQEEDESDQEEDEDIKGLEPDPLLTEDAAYYDDEGNDDIVDLGISMGKLRITERIGGFVRPRFTEELRQAIKEMPTRESSENPFSGQSPSSWMSPSRDYVAPSSSFFFAPGIHRTSLMTYLPSKVLVDKLMDHYWKAVHIIARTVHRPTFERQYEKFWSEISSGVEPRNSFQAVVFAALLSSVISMSDDKVLTEFGVAKDGLVENFKQGTEGALSRANFLHTTRLETLQAFVMYLIPLCRNEVSRAHSALTGTCIRLAECMSLHRDPTNYTSNPVEIHTRRLIWYQICFLDLRTCEATGPRPQIRREDFDTKFPLNVDDVDLERGSAAITATEDRKYFTDMTITRMRFECYEMHRMLWVERPKLEAKKTTLTALLSKIQKFHQAMEKKYLPLLNKTQPLHALAMGIYGILSCRMYIMVLQKFISNEQRIMPERLRQITISTALMILEHSMRLEQTPALADWSWYVGALHQYHTSLLLLAEIYAKEPDPIVEARVWRCVDYVFDLPAGLSGGEKTRMIFEELIGRTEQYAELRRVRAPMKMEHVGPRVHSDAYQREQRERERRSSSVQSATSGHSLSSGSSSQPQHQSQHQQHMGSIEGIANFDFNATYAAASSADTTGAIPTSTADVTQGFNFADYNTSHPGLAPQVSAGVSPGPAQGAGSDTSSTFNQAGVSGGSPMEAMPDIDWNEWDQLFGSAEMSANLLIPPFTFPQFSPSDLQWPTPENLQ